MKTSIFEGNRNGQKKEFPDDFPVTSEFLIMIELIS